MPVYKDENNKGTWYAMFFYTDWTGERKRKKKRGFKTAREAKEYERNFLTKPVTNGDITFQQLYEVYKADMKEKVKESTMDNKCTIIENHILPYFKSKKIADMTAADIRMWQNEILKKKLSDTYMRTINNQISCILNYAVNYHGLPFNPCKTAGLIGAKNAEEMSFWTLDEFNQFIKVVTHPGYHCAFNLLYWSGIRKGELTALTPADVQNGAIIINKTASWRNGQLVVTKPKTKNSKRIVELPEVCYNELTEYISNLYGIREEDRIFDINSNASLNKAFERYIEKAGVKQIRIHDLRHSHASLCIDMGMNILAISERLGHKNIETTLNTYSHLYPNKQKMLALELNKKATENSEK